MNGELEGRTFLVTRTVEGNRIQREKLELQGAKVIDIALIATEEPTSYERIDSALERIGSFAWIVFTSANGVDAFFRRLSQKGEGKSKIVAKFACVGPETAKALEVHGFRASLLPKEFLTCKLAGAMASRFELRGERILLARAEEASNELREILSEAGASVFEAPVYRTVPRKMVGGKPEIAEILDPLTDITLTSPSAVRGLTMNFPPEEIRSRNIRVHCIGPVTAESARKAGLEVRSVAAIHTIDGLVETIASERAG